MKKFELSQESELPMVIYDLKNEQDKHYSIIDILIESKEYKLMTLIINLALLSDKTGLIYNSLTRYLHYMSKESAHNFISSNSFLFKIPTDYFAER